METLFKISELQRRTSCRWDGLSSAVFAGRFGNFEDTSGARVRRSVDTVYWRKIMTNGFKFGMLRYILNQAANHFPLVSRRIALKQGKRLIRAKRHLLKNGFGVKGLTCFALS